MNTRHAPRYVVLGIGMSICSVILGLFSKNYIFVVTGILLAIFGIVLYRLWKQLEENKKILENNKLMLEANQIRIDEMRKQ